MEVDEAPIEGDASLFPGDDMVMMIYGGHPSPQKDRAPDPSTGTLAHYSRGWGTRKSQRHAPPVAALGRDRMPPGHQRCLEPTMTVDRPRWPDHLQFWPRARKAFPTLLVDPSHQRSKGLMPGPRPSFPPAIQGLSPAWT
jgi:hypothetical protein